MNKYKKYKSIVIIFCFNIQVQNSDDCIITVRSLCIPVMKVDRQIKIDILTIFEYFKAYMCLLFFQF